MVNLTRAEFAEATGCKLEEAGLWLNQTLHTRESDGSYTLRMGENAMRAARDGVVSETRAFIESRGVKDPTHLDLAIEITLRRRKEAARSLAEKDRAERKRAHAETIRRQNEIR